MPKPNIGVRNGPVPLALPGVPVTEIAYLAGIIDGEGSISFAYRRRVTHGRTSTYMTPKLQVVNTDEVLIRWVHARCGGGVYAINNVPVAHKPRWLWTSAGNQARQVIGLVRPYLLVKAAQADVILSLERATERFPDTLGRPQLRLTEEQSRKNVEAADEIRRLNRRGTNHASWPPSPQPSS